MRKLYQTLIVSDVSYTVTLTMLVFFLGSMNRDITKDMRTLPLREK